MICQTCGRCRGIKDNNGQYTITCLERGEFKLHSDYEDNFKCEDRIDPVKHEEPPKPNVLVILKTSGRDITLYEKRATPRKLVDFMCDRKAEVLTLGNFAFAMDDISVLAYIGD